MNNKPEVNAHNATSKPNETEDSLEQQKKEAKGQRIEPQQEKWNTQQPANRDEKSPNTKG